MATEDEFPAKISVNNNIEWNSLNEVKLFLSLMGHKPVGIAKHFHMACILTKFCERLNRDDISSQVIWDRLDTMYDLQALEETEALPFPNDTEDFMLPQNEFGTLLDQKRSVKMPPPPAPSPPPDGNKRDDSKDIKKESVKTIDVKKEVKAELKKEDKKANVRDFKRDSKEDSKKDKRPSKDVVEVKKEKESFKMKEIAIKESRSTKRASILKDDEDSSVSSTGSAKKSRDNSDTDDAASTPRRGPGSGANNHSTNSKGKRQTRLSQAKVSDDSGSNKSLSPLTVSLPVVKRRRHV